MHAFGYVHVPRGLQFFLYNQYIAHVPWQISFCSFHDVTCFCELNHYAYRRRRHTPLCVIDIERSVRHDSHTCIRL